MSVYSHHMDAHSMAKAIGGLPYEIIENKYGAIQYLVFISSSVK